MASWLHASFKLIATCQPLICGHPPCGNQWIPRPLWHRSKLLLQSQKAPVVRRNDPGLFYARMDEWPTGQHGGVEPDLIGTDRAFMD